MVGNYPGVKDLIELGLNAEEISVIFGVHSRTIKREARKLGMTLKVGHPPKGPELSQKEKETIYTLATETDYILAKIIRTTGLNARSVYKFIAEEVDQKDWGRRKCRKCGKSFVTEWRKTNTICPDCRGE